MTVCKECSKAVSTDAKVCPNCGAKPKPRKGIGTVILAMIALYVSWAAFSPATSTTAATPTTASVARAVPSPADAARANYLAAFTLDQKGGRTYLTDRLADHCSKEDRHLNYITISTRPAGGGVAFYCVHEFYSKYSLAAGSRAPALSSYVMDHAALLRQNKVTRVGVWGKGEYSSGAWFDVPKP